MLQSSRTHVAKLPNSESVFSGLAYGREMDQASQASHGVAGGRLLLLFFGLSYLGSSALIAQQEKDENDQVHLNTSFENNQNSHSSVRGLSASATSMR